LKQAKNFASAIVAPDPNESSMLMGTAKEVLSSVLPGRK
jgi:pyruvate dehydrogenase (quinone)